MDHLDRILDWGGLTRSEEKHLRRQRMTGIWTLIGQMTPADNRFQVIGTVHKSYQMSPDQDRTRFGNKNARLSFQCTGLDNFIEAVVDGSMVTPEQPDRSEDLVNTMPAACVVVEMPNGHSGSCVVAACSQAWPARSLVFQPAISFISQFGPGPCIALAQTGEIESMNTYLTLIPGKLMEQGFHPEHQMVTETYFHQNGRFSLTGRPWGITCD